jgi:Tfp pilus assembly protein PilF
LARLTHALAVALFAGIVQAALAAGGSGSGGTCSAGGKGDASFQAGVAAIERQDWPAAIRAFRLSLQWDRFNTDAHNWLGYAYRNAGDMMRALAEYEEALRLDPQHKGAHEYLGGAYVMVKDLAKAEQHLAALERLCGHGCQEYRDLDEAIRKARTGG